MSRVPSSIRRSWIAPLALAGILAAGAAIAGTDVGSINFTVGRKSFTSDWYLGPRIADATGQAPDPGRAGQPALGIELTWGRQGWPASIALDVLHSYDDGITHVPGFFTAPAFDQRLRASTIEIGLGARRAWTIKGFSPYIGAGGSWVRSNVLVEISDPSESQFGAAIASARSRESAFGFWAGGGIYRRIGPRFQLGLAGRYSRAMLPEHDLFLDGVSPPFAAASIAELDGGGQTIHLVVGWSFPSRK